MSKPGFAANLMAQSPVTRLPQCRSGSLPGRDCFPICHGSSLISDGLPARLTPRGHARPPGV